MIFFATQCQAGRWESYFEFRVFVSFNDWFLFLFWYGCDGGCAGCVVSVWWELYFVCWIGRRELIFGLVGVWEIYFGWYAGGRVGGRLVCVCGWSFWFEFEAGGFLWPPIVSIVSYLLLWCLRKWGTYQIVKEISMEFSKNYNRCESNFVHNNNCHLAKSSEW